jgi:hypothetical protein
VSAPEAASQPLDSPAATPRTLEGLVNKGIPCTSVNVRCIPSAVYITVLPVFDLLTSAKKAGIYGTLPQTIESDSTVPPAPLTQKSSSLSALGIPCTHLINCIELGILWKAT